MPTRGRIRPAAGTALDRWTASRVSRLRRDPFVIAAGATVIALPLDLHRSGARWDGWHLRVVGLVWFDPSPAIVFAPGRDWPVISHVGDDGVAQTVQWWFLRASPPTERLWLELQWRPGWTASRLILPPFRYADAQALEEYPGLVADGVALFQAKAPGRPVLNPVDVRTELYGAWRAHVDERGELPGEADLLDRLPSLTRETLYARIRLLRRADIPWPPEGDPTN